MQSSAAASDHHWCRHRRYNGRPLLQRAGLDVPFFERADDCGSWVWFTAVGKRFLKAIQKMELNDVLEAGAPVLAGNVRTWRGDILFDLRSNITRVWAAYTVVHRAECCPAA